MDNIEQPRPKAVFRKGYALCSPSNELQPDSFAKSQKKAIKRQFGKKGWKKSWSTAEGEGWTLKLVYMRLFVPVFYSSFAPSTELVDAEIVELDVDEDVTTLT
jgi:hypothetical protein